MIFSKQLVNWYLQNKRDLPWRKTQDPYLIWLSEIMLQQTRVAQGLPYYESFVNAFPTVFDLANASEEQVLKLWQGLGYYSRARNLHHTARFIANELDGKFPGDYKSLLALKGVGDYTVAAIASFAFGEKVPVVDGNVFRVLSRVFGVETDISNASAKKEFQELALQLMTQDSKADFSQVNWGPAIFNQAIMEFGALQCAPKNPNCEVCVFNTNCVALKNGMVANLPLKTKKTKVTNRFLNYLIFEDQHHYTRIQKRSEKGIWYNLYEFPLIETESDANLEELIALVAKQYSNSIEITAIESLQLLPIRHKLSHQNLSIQFWKVSTNGVLPDGMPFSEVVKMPFPIVIYNFIERFKTEI
jgi:A/G-specific adenine glycosylase